MPEPKTYAPLNIKKNDRVNFFCLNTSFRADKMIEFINKHKNENGYVNLQITEKREVDQYGNSHTCTLDTWKPQQRDGQQQATERKPTKPSDLPSAEDFPPF